MTLDPQNPTPGDGQGGGTSPQHWLETLSPEATITTTGEDGNEVEIPLGEHPKMAEFKGKDLTEFAKSYLNAQKLIGQKDGLKPLPEDASDEDKAAWEKAYRELLGVPESPEGYEIQLPEGDVRDEGMSKWFAETAHSLGMPPAMAQRLSDAFNKFGQSFWADKMQADEDAGKAALVEVYESEEKAAEATELAKRGFVALAGKAGISKEEADIFTLAYGNDPVFVRLFDFIGKSFKEDDIPGGGGPSGGGDGEVSTEDFYKKQVFGGK